MFGPTVKRNPDRLQKIAIKECSARITLRTYEDQRSVPPSASFLRLPGNLSPKIRLRTAQSSKKRTEYPEAILNLDDYDIPSAIVQKLPAVVSCHGTGDVAAKIYFSYAHTGSGKTYPPP